MAQNYSLLKELLNLLEMYELESDGREASMVSFSIWLNQHLSYPSPGMVMKEKNRHIGMEEIEGEQAETVMTMLISYLYRYAKNYAKKALEGTPLSTIDEFTFLATLSYRGSLTKTELINLHLLEITSGIEIIKRLTSAGLMESFSDPNDKRSKRVKLTGEGKRVLNSVMDKMDEVAHIVAGNLSEEERNQLLPLLHKLNDFHAVIHYQDRKTELNQIREKYFNSSRQE
ncbi:MAG: winged helix DNA-binding protein [Bacteroidia bacterium]|nr:winged helix DNA-binding protein [Bacteroidia bacterium]